MLTFLSHLTHRRNWGKVPRSLPYSPHHAPTSRDLKEGYLQLWSSTRTTKPEGKSRMRPPASTSGPPSGPLRPPPPPPRNPGLLTPGTSSLSPGSAPPLLPPTASAFVRWRPASAGGSSAANPETCPSRPRPHPGRGRGGRGVASSSAFRLPVPSCRSRTLPGPPASSYRYPHHSPAPQSSAYRSRAACPRRSWQTAEWRGRGAVGHQQRIGKPWTVLKTWARSSWGICR